MRGDREAATAVSQEFPSTRNSDKRQLIKLSDSVAKYSIHQSLKSLLAVATKEAMSNQLQSIKKLYDGAFEGTKKAERDLEAFSPDVEAATSARISLQKQLDNLEAETAFLQRVHSEEIEDLMKQSYSTSECVDVSCSIPDLAPALRDIQMESEEIAAKNLQETDEWYKTRFLDFNQPSTKHAENVRRFREETGNCKRSVSGFENPFQLMLCHF
ncbi:desmin-like [Chelonoidis abingdonii]|uniref:desmin-like n=1 Tax=Chelonoidis abingdonii TaxID=106734 RepID=UPI003F4997A8